MSFVTRFAYAKEALIFVCLLAITAGISVCIVFLFGLNEAKPAGDGITREIEEKLKQSILADIAREERTIDTPLVADAINTIRGRLLEKAPKMEFDPEILLVDSNEVNAAAFPGGLVVVYTGLIKLTDDPEELAAVIAHEMGHVAARDSIELIIRKLGIAVVLATVTRGEGTTPIGRIIETLIDASYSQEQETAADRFACETLENSGIDPAHLARFFGKLRDKVGDSDPGIFKYLSTHPEIEKRIDEANACAKAARFEEKKFDMDWKKIKSVLPSYFDD